MIVKDRLCPREFLEFVENLKQFQKKEIKKEEALENAKNIFGDENEDLYNTFKDMLIQ